MGHKILRKKCRKIMARKWRQRSREIVRRIVCLKKEKKDRDSLY